MLLSSGVVLKFPDDYGISETSPVIQVNLGTSLSAGFKDHSLDALLQMPN